MFDIFLAFFAERAVYFTFVLQIIVPLRKECDCFSFEPENASNLSDTSKVGGSDVTDSEFIAGFT